MKMDKAFCPNCGAPVHFEDGREDTFCQHCGTQVFKIDEQLDIKLKHEENTIKLLNERNKNSDKTIIFALGLLILLAIFCILFL